jgi:hypothetical protein
MLISGLLFEFQHKRRHGNKFIITDVEHITNVFYNHQITKHALVNMIIPLAVTNIKIHISPVFLCLLLHGFTKVMHIESSICYMWTSNVFIYIWS